MSTTSDPTSPAELRTRAATASDAAPIARLIRESKAAAMPWLPLVHTPEEDLGWVSGVLLRDHAVTVVSREEMLVGILATSPE